MKKPSLYECITALLTLCSIVVSCFSLHLSNKANKSTDSLSAKSIEISERNYDLAQRVFDSTISNNQKMLQSQSKGLDLAKNEFDIRNRPYLQITNVFFVAIKEPYRAITVYFKFENLGNYPAKLINADFKYALISDISEAKALHDIPVKISSLNRYAVKDHEDTVSTGIILSSESYKLLTSRKCFLYFSGSVRYINLISGKKCIYRSEIKTACHPDGTYSSDYLLNENL